MFLNLLNLALYNTSVGFIHLRITTLSNYSPMLPCLPFKTREGLCCTRISLDEAIELLLQDREKETAI